MTRLPVWGIISLAVLIAELKLMSSEDQEIITRFLGEEIEAVAAFLDDKIPFTAIPETIGEVMDAAPPGRLRDLDDVLDADRAARERARQALQSRGALRASS